MSLFCQTQRKIFWRKFVTRWFWGTIDFHSRTKNTMEVNGAPELLCFPHSSEYLPLCSAEQRHSNRFGTIWGWVNDDRIFIFGWSIPLTLNDVLAMIVCECLCTVGSIADCPDCHLQEYGIVTGSTVHSRGSRTLTSPSQTSDSRLTSGFTCSWAKLGSYSVRFLELF